jgi:LysM repeat protein
MKSLRQLLTGLLTALGTGLLVLAAGMLALAEGGSAPALPPSSSPVASSITATPVITITPLASPLAEQTLPPTQTLTPAVTPTEEHRCQKTPKDWGPYVIQAGDTLASLAAETGQSSETILDANCLYSPDLLEGTILYLPFTTPSATVPPALPTTVPTVQVVLEPTAISPTTVPYTPVPVPCRRPSGWVAYTVQPGDTLYRLSLALGISQYQLQTANCMTGTFLYAGQILYVPRIPVRTATAASTATRTPEPSSTPAAPTTIPSVIPTNTPLPPTATPITPTASPGDPPKPSETAPVTPAATLAP